MKYFYPDENESSLSRFEGGENLFAEPEKRFRLLRIDRYSGPRRERPPTSHEHWELTAVLEGTGYLRTPEGDFPLLEDSAVLIPPGTVHAEDSPGRMTLLWLGFEASFRPGAAPEKLTLLQAPEVCRRLTGLWEEVVKVPDLSALTIDGRFLLLLEALFRALHRRNASADDAISRVLASLNANWQRPLTVAELAGMVGWSPGHLSRRFTAGVGVSPGEYLIGLRLRQAMTLLRESDLKVREVAQLCGFRDPYYFSRLFRRRIGRSPAAYRDSEEQNVSSQR